VKKWIYRAAIGVGVLGVITAGYIGCAMTAKPVWYVPIEKRSPAEIDAAARRFEDRIVDLQNAVAAAVAAEARARKAGVSGGAMPPLVARIPTGDFTAFLAKWSKLQGWDQRIDAVLGSPTISTEGGAVVVGGLSRDVGLVVSIRVRPELVGEGQLRVRVEGARVGSLPVPVSMVKSRAMAAAGGLRQKVSGWSSRAALDARGLGNDAMMFAWAGQTGLAALADQDVGAEILWPLDERRGLPVQLTGVRVEGADLMLEARGLTPAERQNLLVRIKGQ
jgi:hypothetical protein